MQDTPESIKAATEWGLQEAARLEKERKEAYEKVRRISAKVDEMLGFTPEQARISRLGCEWAEEDGTVIDPSKREGRIEVGRDITDTLWGQGRSDLEVEETLRSYKFSQDEIDELLGG